MTPEELAAIKERLKNATPGPWAYKAGFLKHYVFSLDEHEDFGISLQEMHWKYGHEVPAAANAQLIAHAPTDIANLIAALEAQQQAVEQARREAFERACKAMCLDCDAGEKVELDKYGGAYPYNHVFEVEDATFRRHCWASRIRKAMQILLEPVTETVELSKEGETPIAPI